MTVISALMLALLQGFRSLRQKLFTQPAVPLSEDDRIRITMTTPPTPKRHPLRTYKDLPDMSTQGDPGKIVTVYVGYQSHGFQVHRDRLGPLAKLLDDPLSKLIDSISLPNEKADTFNALVNWIYHEPLPRAAKASEYNVDGTGGLAPISTSVKALTDLAWGKDLPAGSKGEKPKLGNAGLEDAHATQCLLLDLMMLAERYGWEKLYNAAIDAFREGEANLQRERPDLLHIEVVYQRTAAESPIRQFLGDYVYALARADRNLTWYLREKWFEKIPELLADMLKRVDEKGPFQYPFDRGASKDKDKENGEGGEDDGEKQDEREVLAQETPLDLSATTYHIHDGRMMLDCERSDDGGCSVE
ncbi:hypothetical protein EKO27_g4559 [Xylaria grammica]|uniref:BTB domain-containing protein n=1 Tax=Xylaria grammica TaxID=363999 RepID=A0A439D830_9PEZI|nr:hypothetical protein EKO27_g4559 [Xylaria grammica]